MTLHDNCRPARFTKPLLAVLGCLGVCAASCAVGATLQPSPRTRYESVAGLSLPAPGPGAVEAFLDEPMVVDEPSLAAAPRIVAGEDGRVLLARGDRIYARSSTDAPLPEPTAESRNFRMFRNVTPLKDPGTGEILGYEAHYLGRAVLRRGESFATAGADHVPGALAAPATFDIVAAREEIRAGDRLLLETPRQPTTAVPHAPDRRIDGRIVSIYGHASQFAGQHQIVTLNKGARDGIESGHLLAILKNGGTRVDHTAATSDTIRLPDERIGLLMVFRPFEKVSYALVLEVSDTPRAGDFLVNP